MNTPDDFMPLMPRKRCGQCGDNKAICFFYDDQKAKDGKDSVCMSCQQGRNREMNRRYKPRPTGERPFEIGIRALKIFN